MFQKAISLGLFLLAFVFAAPLAAEGCRSCSVKCAANNECSTQCAAAEKADCQCRLVPGLGNTQRVLPDCECKKIREAADGAEEEPAAAADDQRARIEKKDGWVDLHNGASKCLRIKCTGRPTGSSGCLEIEFDNSSSDLGLGQTTDVTGKRISIMASGEWATYNQSKCD